ncbi:retrovirus-related Pol polyprotein from transposon 17.6 [Trichonephila clavipes]|nr:retrovirus-related Pol polyprotein from transposon 17.6 [Trichonephila clavipes]
MLQLAEELGINATLNMTVPSLKIAITNSEGYEEEFVKNLYETIIANGKDWKSYNFLPVEILNAVQTRSQVKAAREERGIDSGDAKKGEDEVIIVSSDAEDEILIPALQEYVPELALLRVTRENLINAQKNSEEIKPLYEQAANQVQVTNQVYSLEKELLVKNREDKLGNVVKSILLALRTVSHESTGYTPSELVYGKNLRTPETLVMEHWMEPEEEGDLVTEYMFKLINRLKKMSRSSYK